MKQIKSFENSKALFSRAEKVIPCGIYGHTTPAMVVPGAYPYYAKRAKGSHYWDVDNNEYIDWLCGYGPIILGHQHPVVEEAGNKASKEILCSNHPAPVMVELAEYLVNLIDFSSWAVFGKNGSDMTNWAIQVARDYTKRKKILKIQGAYHGIGPWATPGYAGLIEEDLAHIHTFIWNDLNSVEYLLKKYQNQIAGLIITPFHHPAFANAELPLPSFLQELEKRCRQEGIILILDDIRAGFRLHHGGSHRYFGFEPDLICLCKALANGHPISATLGRKELRIAASRVFLTGSYWNNPAPMAASLACLQILEAENAIAKMFETGTKLMNGLTKAAEEFGFNAQISGPVTLPFLSFKGDSGFHLLQQFCIEMVKEGIFLHPHHNWFVSAAHSKEDVERSIDAAKSAFSTLRKTIEQSSNPVLSKLETLYA